MPDTSTSTTATPRRSTKAPPHRSTEAPPQRYTTAPSPRPTTPPRTTTRARARALLFTLFLCLLLWWALRTVVPIPITIIPRVMYRDRSYHVFQIHRNITNMVRYFMQYV
ncbi:unnamed protein product [Chrysodeixis includens]|uniref:Uncharacterized protein n=1 Tax=Chrysodeixis includens TaxID=689277 RepID=A0A9N8PZI8_CHRIL|nr:unnamed protein product [Chrysodeixis includens]